MKYCIADKSLNVILINKVLGKVRTCV